MFFLYYIDFLEDETRGKINAQARRTNAVLRSRSSSGYISVSSIFRSAIPASVLILIINAAYCTSQTLKFKKLTYNIP